MLHCTRKIAACKQIDCLWHLVYIDCPQNAARGTLPRSRRGQNVQNRLSRLPRVHEYFSRLMASIDRFLANSARIAVRNGDLPYFGL
jgi:hypothetical protein